jgi:hypothetical protein
MAAKPADGFNVGLYACTTGWIMTGETNDDRRWQWNGHFGG